MRELAIQILKKNDLLEYAKEVRQKFRQLKLKIRKTDRPIIDNYFSTHETRKLHIGCGNNPINGWLNSDYSPSSAAIIQLDATHIFPFKNDTFDYIFSEHMIEHITYSNGLKMLNECHRVLKKNGKIRLSTPDLRFLIDLYQSNKSELQIQYMEWAVDQFTKSPPYPDDTFIINNFFRDWGHQFIYDEKTLRSSMEKAGFKGIIRWKFNESKEDALRNLENEKRAPKDFLKLETFTLEGTK